MNRLLAAAALLLAAPAALAQDAAPAAETDVQVLERLTGEMMKKVEELRGLKFKHDVKRVWKSRDEAKTEMLAEIEKQLPAEKVAALSRDMAFFGLIPEGSDIKTIFADFIAAGAGGYYNPDNKTFSLVRGFNENASRPIVFHELVHAVEDQYYDYNERQEAYEKQDLSDKAAALQAVVEGSARYWEDVFVDAEAGLRLKYFQGAMAQEGGAESAGKVMALPPAIIIGMVMYPYGNGSEFHKAVLPALKAETPQAAFDRIFASPPMSTEQILHPEKYLDSDLPRTVRLPALDATLGEGWTFLRQDTQGEFGAGIVVNATMYPYNMAAQSMQVIKMPKVGFKNQDEAIKFNMTPVVEFKGATAKAIQGWDGDRYGVFVNGDRTCVAWVSVWDTPEDAQEFAERYGAVIEKKYGKTVEEEGKKTSVSPTAAALEVGGAKGTRWEKTRDGDSAVLVAGDRVVILERCPGASLEAAAAALVRAEVVRDPKDSLPAK